MTELFEQLRTIARAMWRYRWQGVAAAWIVGALASIAAFLVPNKYEATARIYVDTQSILKPLMSGLAVQPNVEQQVVMLSRTLISRPNVEKLIRMADLSLKAHSAAEQDLLVVELTRDLEIKSVGRDNLYTLAYKAADAAKAQRVIQSLVSIFVESSMGASRKDTDTAKVFINEQIKSYQTKLEEAEARLKEFRLKNIGLQAEEGKDSAARLANLNEQLSQARLELREAEQARDAAKQQLSSEHAAHTALPNLLPDSSTVAVATPEIDSRIDAQRKNLDALLQRYTELHPDIVATRRLIADLEQQKVRAMAEARRAALARPVTQNQTANASLAQQEMARVLASAEVQVAALRARVSEYSARHAAALGAMKTAPQLEAEAAKLNRDYEIHKKNYETLVSRRESAAMSGDLDQAAGVADFRLIDPPRVSPRPVSPNRLLLLAGALVVSVAAGLGVAFAASQLRPVFHSVADLTAQIELPLLGVVTRIASAADLQFARRDRLQFVAASSGLLVVFTGVLAITAALSLRQG